MKGGIYIETIFIDGNVLVGNTYGYKCYVTYGDGTKEEITQVSKIEATTSMFVDDLFTVKDILKIHTLANERVLSVESRDLLISVLEQSILNVNVLDLEASVVLDYTNIVQNLIQDLNLELKEESDSNGVVNEEVVSENNIKRNKQKVMIQEMLRYIYLFELTE